MARKSKYREEYHLPWIRGLTRRGYTLEEIADDVGVAVSTLKKWIHDSQELSDAIKNARALPDISVEDSLFKRAKGFTKTTRKTTILADVKDDGGGTAPTKIEIFEEEVPPDTVACIFWLKNRNPELWRDVQDVSGKINAGVDLKPLTKQEIEMLSKMTKGEEKK